MNSPDELERFDPNSIAVCQTFSNLDTRPIDAFSGTQTGLFHFLQALTQIQLPFEALTNTTSTRLKQPWYVVEAGVWRTMSAPK
jgi:hypothetical protein